MGFQNYRKFLIAPGQHKIVPTSLTPEQASADVGFLLEALEKAYPVQWAMSSEHWQQILLKISSLKFTRDISPEILGELLADILWEIPDGHLKVKLNGLVLGKGFKEHLRPPTTGTNLANLNAKEFWKVEQRSSAAGKVSVIAISGFPQASEPEWMGFTDAVKSTLQAKAIIVDLRGNGGGDDTKAQEMVAILLGRELEVNWVKEIICETAEAYALQLNTYESIIWSNYESKNIAPPLELIQAREALKLKAQELSLKPLTDSRVINQAPTESSVNPTPLAYQGKIFVLIDPRTVSSGEWTALYLQKHPNTIIVGENTYGMIHFGNTGQLRLPNSLISIALCMKINELTDGRFFEKMGIPPDRPVSDQDSLEYILSQLI